VVVALEEGHNELPFQLANLLRQSRSRDLENGGRPGEVQLAGDGTDVLKLTRTDHRRTLSPHP
jgi:hypothetical protein